MNVLQLMIFLTCLTLYSCHDIPFNSEKWKNWEETESNMRLRLDMTDHLITNYDLIGQSYPEIKNLLGESEQECERENCWIQYNLGPCRGFGVDYGVLTIKFRNGKAVKVDKLCH